MVGIHWNEVAEGVLIGTAVVLTGGFFSVFGWLWKRSIYGRMELYREEHKAEIKLFKDELQSQITNDRHNFQASLQVMGELIKAETSKITNTVSNLYSKKQDAVLCDALRMGCAGRIVEKIHSIEEGIETVKEHFDGQIRLILDSNEKMMERIDNVLMAIAEKK